MDDQIYVNGAPIQESRNLRYDNVLGIPLLGQNVNAEILVKLIGVDEWRSSIIMAVNVLAVQKLN